LDRAGNPAEGDVGIKMAGKARDWEHDTSSHRRTAMKVQRVVATPKRGAIILLSRVDSVKDAGHKRRHEGFGISPTVRVVGRDRRRVGMAVRVLQDMRTV